MKIEHFIMLIVAGVIVADLVSHVAGTNSLVKGFNVLWDIAVEPTDTGLLSTTLSNNYKTGTTAKKGS